MKTSKKCPICREHVSDVKCLSKYSASPLSKMVNSIAGETVNDILSEPQSPAMYIEKMVAKRENPLRPKHDQKATLYLTKSFYILTC